MKNLEKRDGKNNMRITEINGKVFDIKISKKLEDQYFKAKNIVVAFERYITKKYIKEGKK